MRSSLRITCCLAAASLAACHPAHPPSGVPLYKRFYVTYTPSYIESVRAIDLGTLPGNVASRARSVNDSGQAAGESVDSGGAPHAVLWLPGQAPRNLETAAIANSSAFGINVKGAVTGWYNPKVGHERGFVWNGTMTPLTALWQEVNGDTAATWPVAISDSGVVVATAAQYPYGLVAYWTNPNQPAQYISANLSLGGGDMTAEAVNNSGMIVGEMLDSADGFEWEIGAGGGPWCPEPGDIAECMPQAINDNGATAGWLAAFEQNYLQQHAYYWNGTDTAPTDLGTLVPGDVTTRSIALGVNALGYVVGWSEINPATQPRPTSAFFWGPTFGLTALGGLPGVDSSHAIGINPHLMGDSIFIVGSSSVGTTTHATMWIMKFGLVPHVHYNPDLAYNPVPYYYWGITSNPAEDQPVEAALLGAPDFDVTTVDVESVRLNGSPVRRATVRDVNHDGRPDLVLSFSFRQLVADGAVTQHTRRFMITGKMRGTGRAFTNITPVYICTRSARACQHHNP